MENELFLDVQKFGHITIIMYFKIVTPINHHFQFGTNGKVVVLGVPILMHFRVSLVSFLIFKLCSPHKKDRASSLLKSINFAGLSVQKAWW